MRRLGAPLCHWIELGWTPRALLCSRLSHRLLKEDLAGGIDAA
jgi:hypothetical protein